MNTETDFTKLVESYAQFILDGMDYKTLEVFAFETLVDNLIKITNHQRNSQKHVTSMMRKPYKTCCHELHTKELKDQSQQTASNNREKMQIVVHGFTPRKIAI